MSNDVLKSNDRLHVGALVSSALAIVSRIADMAPNTGSSKKMDRI